MVNAPLASVWVQRCGNKVVVAAGLLLVTAALLLFNTLDSGSDMLRYCLSSMVMGVGMANIMAPATDSVMGSLPRAKAGVGSAVNDTTRQMGGAVGVAVLGSVLASSFHGSMADKLASVLPAPLLEAVKDNVGQAIGIARELPAAQPFAAQIVDAGHPRFVRRLQLAFPFTLGRAGCRERACQYVCISVGRRYLKK